jgi:non-specific serine/threonine protein kinase/serine/threonine-protein kinase
VDPPPPSAAAGKEGRALRGELDDIILLAMRKDPEERYGSVQAFSDDIRAWLEGREVKAHPEPLWRRSLKTARRHRAVSLATGLAVVSILAGSVVSIWQARTAQRERVRAENNFREVRQFSRAVLFELNDAIRNLPGSTPARLLLVERATEMLDNLSRTAAGDPALMMELAEGYRRVGQIQGSTFSDNVGQVDAAISSFRKAVRLAENAVAATVGSAEASILLEDTYEDLGDAVLPKDPGESDAIYAKHRVLVEQLDKVQRPESRTRLAVATGYSSLGFHQIQRNHFPEAKADFQRATERFEALAGKASELREWRVQYAFALKRLGAILIKEEALEPAEVSYRKALAIEDADVAANPKERRKIIDRTMTLSDLALIQRKRGNLDAAMRSYSEVVRIRTEALDADPKNLRLLRLTVGAELNLANVDGEAGRHEEALSLGRMALSRREEAQRAGLGQAEDLANAQVSVAILLASAAEHSRGPERGRLLAEGESLVRKAAPVLSTPQGERQTLAQQNSWEQLVEARVRLKKAAAAR